ncbi:MAG: hypothetical protein IT439_09570 [Phycisphaerales bacterium]|nr:hypothetical protein [Phycisphaerales bacterium]
MTPLARVAFAFARESLTDQFGAQESLSWMGVPWQWCYRYDRNAGKPVAYLVPAPARPLLALPLSAHALAERAVGSLTRRPQDAIAAGTRVGEVIWLSWEVSSRNAVDEALALLPAEVVLNPARKSETARLSRAPVGASGRSGR